MTRDVREEVRRGVTGGGKVSDVHRVIETEAEGGEIVG